MISRRVAELCWPQVRGYQLGGDTLLLKEFVRAERCDPTAVSAIGKASGRGRSRTIPSPGSKRVNGADNPFLYDITAGHRVSFEPGASDALDGCIAPLIRPLVELHWVREVASWNQIATEGRPLRHHRSPAAKRLLREAPQRALIHAGR